MTKEVIICDDSSFARKQMARALPDTISEKVEFAKHGAEALEMLNNGFGEILFLDLNMPVMDGYETLDAINRGDYELSIIVVSGDIQPGARTRVQALGAMDFIKKPIEQEALAEVLAELDLIDLTAVAKTTKNKPLTQKKTAVEKPPVTTQTVNPAELIDIYQEITNVAMGQAADLLARLLNVFVQLPVPKVNELEKSELQMLLTDISQNQTVSVICQGFIGFGISGEALLIFNDASIDDIAELMQYQENENESDELELLMDISNVLIGACLNGIATQLDVKFSQGHPVVLGQHVNIADLIQSTNKHNTWKKTLAAEINYAIEGRNINCDLLLLFSEDSLPSLAKRASFLMDE